MLHVYTTRHTGFTITWVERGLSHSIYAFLMTDEGCGLVPLCMN